MLRLANLSSLPDDFLFEMDRAQTRGGIHYTMKVLSNLPQRLSLREKQELFLHTFSFTFVRHPFVRIVSAYRGKVVR